jgi:hypothetical protein
MDSAHLGVYADSMCETARMSSDSQAVAGQEPQGDSPAPAQEQATEVVPKQRFDGLMATMSRRTQERDLARAELERLREAVNADFRGEPAPEPQQQQQPDHVQEQTDDDGEDADAASHDQRWDEPEEPDSPAYARAIASGALNSSGIHANNVSRKDSSPAENPNDLKRLRAELDASWRSVSEEFLNG